jgi:hypothetical protein
MSARDKAHDKKPSGSKPRRLFQFSRSQSQDALRNTVPILPDTEVAAKDRNELEDTAYGKNTRRHERQHSSSSTAEHDRNASMSSTSTAISVRSMGSRVRSYCGLTD